MAERTLDQALNRADGLRMIADFREDYSNVGDQDDIVVLADEILRLQKQNARLVADRETAKFPWEG